MRCIRSVSCEYTSTSLHSASPIVDARLLSRESDALYCFSDESEVLEYLAEETDARAVYANDVSLRALCELKSRHGSFALSLMVFRKSPR